MSRQNLLFPNGRKISPRLEIEDWDRRLNDPSQSDEIKAALENALTPSITRYLPLSMHFPPEAGGIGAWIKDRQEEAQVLSIHDHRTGDFVGLILLHGAQDDESGPALHVGYFIREDYWGMGFATEALALVAAIFKPRPGKRLLAGVDADNRASAKVLTKVGFARLAEFSTGNREFFELEITG